jgi:hypothetical protein
VNRRGVFIALAALAGIASGPWALDAAVASQPPVDWGLLAFMAGGTIIAVPVVLGFQAAVNPGNGFARGWEFSVPAASYCLGAGVGSLGVSIWRSDLGPQAFLFTALGLAMFIGLVIAKTLYASRRTNVR